MSDFALRERELHHREELLRWKHKNFVLQQELDRARGKDLAQPREPGDSMISPPPLSAYDLGTETYETAPDDSVSEHGWDDPFAGFKGAHQQTQIKLPRRR
jgi:hypothetical protein